MDRFSNDRAALDFVASRIADEAKREGVPFSDVERKMLYFSETAWTLSDIGDASDEFDREYDPNVYEQKVSVNQEGNRPSPSAGDRRLQRVD